ncbi:MAG: pantetheine-phosphate adenylyltransferase [Ruminococcaceae bacterium]|nr:pantetheine-phosphate adenylyltransferase [Oscillospiraceae bacterium]
MNNKKALITGSFDPPTVGHLDVIKRASSLFDDLTVCIFRNSNKKYTFAEETRVKMLSAMCKDIPNVKIDCSDKPVVIYAKENSINFIVKGARNARDFDYEKDLHNVGVDINPETETLLLFSRPEYERVSSSTVRELMKYDLDLSKYLTPEVIEIIEKEKTK